MGFTSAETLAEVQKLFDKMFDINSLLDRQVYVLDIDFNLTKYQQYIHKISHIFPLLADKIQEFGSLRGDLFYRDIVPKHDEQYVSVASTSEKMVYAFVELEKLCQNAIRQAITDGDFMYEDFLRAFEVDELAKFTKQAVVFFNAISQYEDHCDIHLWNKDFESYIIPELAEV